MTDRLAAWIALAALTPAACGRSPSVAEGRDLYNGNGCANCHGADGHGDGAIAFALTPRPRDFRDRAAFKQGDSEAAIAATIRDGVQAGGSMPRFPQLSERERRSLAEFIRTLQIPSSKGSE